MTYLELVSVVGQLELFDLPLLVQAFDVKRPSLCLQLSRWMKDGKVIGLRRGYYTLPDQFRKMPPNLASLANQLYRPSYLSGLWALGYYDLIPERVVWLTSVTSRVPRRFENPLGVFDYRNIKRSLFFGYGVRNVGGRDVLVAEPEKALLDYWHSQSGEWTVDRLAEMRFQLVEKISVDRLKTFAAAFESPRLNRAVERWLKLVAEEAEGWVQA